MTHQAVVEEEIYTHEFLWRSATKVLSNENDDSYHFIMPSLLMSYLAFEAFINFCGYALLPEVWKNEKENFKGKGIEEKIKVITNELPNFNWKKGENPYQTIKRVGCYRDMLAHGKVVQTTYETTFKNDGSHFRYEHDWDSFLTRKFVLSARTCIQDFCNSLLVELRKVSEHNHLNYEAFKGSLGSAKGSPTAS
ncbi:hypothetical protein [Colwellia piezophila]|uniref:hypothetical protein n=1 Tax=Colwellia piezophila TaxID=211668 RepID=UPI00038161E3|nr:hypothetical protein [Colwellia piezophila]